MIARALTTSASDQWHTPADLECEIRAFLGGDYYDPCPARISGRPIANGLWTRWTGRVYCNPPYGRVIVKWVNKALDEPVDELILLVPARTDARWFQPLFQFPICFIRGRLKFSGCKNNAPFPSAIIYRGPRAAAFAAAFAHRGAVVTGGRITG